MSEQLASKAEPWPLTAREQIVLAMYYRKYGAGGSALHSNLVYAVVLRGVVDAEALQLAAQRVFAENPVLHSFFSAADAAVQQKFQPDAASTPVPFAFFDYSGNGRAFKQAVRNAIATHFDLSSGRLVRLTLVKRTANRYIFVLTAHHLLMDGWSILMLLRILSKYYSGGKKQTDKLAIGNQELLGYIEQRKNYLASTGCQVEQHALVEWLRPIADNLRPQVDVTFPMATEVQRLLRFDRDAVQRAMTELRISGTELHRILFVMLIHWLTGDKDIGFSESHTNRPVRARRLFGFFSDDLLLRVSAAHGATLVTAVAESYQRALGFQRLPAMRVMMDLLGVAKLPRFHFNPIGNVGVDALRLKGASARHFKAMKSYALAEVNLIGFNPQHVLLVLAEPVISGKTVDDMERALHGFLADLMKAPRT